MMRSSLMMFVHPIPMRHTQMFTCLLLIASREWPHSESRLTLGPLEMFYHSTSSNTPIPIAVIKQVTLLALMQATPSSLPTMVPRYPSLNHPITLQHGSPGAQPYQINSCWYVTDTPGPIIIGIQLCERLEDIKMNCAIKVTQKHFQATES